VSADGSRVVRPGDVPPADYARITLQVGVAAYGGRWGFDSRAGQADQAAAYTEVPDRARANRLE
jgi:hypothetical protein